MAKRTFIRIRSVRSTAGNGASARDLASVQEDTQLLVIELGHGQLFDIAILVKPAENLRGQLPVDLACLPQRRGSEVVQADTVVLQRLFLAFVVCGHIIFQPALVPCFFPFPVALLDGRAVAVRPRQEDDILLADPVPQESGKNIGVHEHAAHMPEVQVLVAVGHARSDDRPFGECGSFIFQ